MSKMRVKDIKRDEVEEAVADATGQLRDLAGRNAKLLTIAAVALAAVVLVITGTRWWVHRQALSAQGGYAAAAKLADGLLSPPPPDTEPPTSTTWADVATAFEGVASKFPSTSAGRLASFQAGAARLRAGDAPAAIAVLSAFTAKEPRHWATPHALQLLATAHEEAGNLDAAEAALKQVQVGDWPSYPPGVATQRLAEFYDRADRDDESNALWKMLADDARFADTSAQSAAKSRSAKAPTLPIQ